MLTFQWVANDLENGQFQESLVLNHKVNDRQISGYKVHFPKLHCVKQQEKGPDEIVLSVSVDGTPVMTTEKREGFVTNGEWVLNKEATITGNFTASIYEEDDPPIDGHDDMGTQELSLADMQEAGTGKGTVPFGEGGGQYRLYWELHPIYAD